MVLYFIKEPSLKLYYVSENHFTTNKKEAHAFTDRNEALEVQKEWLDKGIDLQIENV